MGRWSTGAATCEGAQRIELSKLQKSGFLQKGEQRSGKMSWNNGSTIGIRAVWTEAERYIELLYSITNSSTGTRKDYNSKILLESVPSNLGKGEILYFVCPVIGKRCRILYRAYGSHIWKCREAYRNRLYYQSQLSSKLDYANDRYWSIDKKLKEIREEEGYRLSYGGKPTSKARYIEALEAQQESWDVLRLSRKYIPKNLLKLMEKYKDRL